ncbi:MAG: DUF4293 domain-containing protein [Paramuribaculum sp.]|nr:DUF4293 domain-containing protein [Paramuribaculum sp.]MDE6322517.1 DUF4293 domain-containing protein [Paramuribaculum sp.]
MFLLIAIGLTIALFFVPFGYAPTLDEVARHTYMKSLLVTDFLWLILSTGAALVAMVVAIFTYRNYSLQKLATVFGAVFLLTTIGVVIYAIVTPYVEVEPDISIATAWGWGVVLLFGALVADLLAYRYISKDQRLIRSYDRIR